MSARESTTPQGGKPAGAFLDGVLGYRQDRSTRARLARGSNPRSGAPVWRNSYTVGQIEDRIWKPINGGSRRGGRRWTAAMLRAARKFETRTLRERRKVEPGARNGKLGEVGLRVLTYLYDTVDYATGRLEPAVRTIADELALSYSAVHRALQRLREHRFISWMRRSVPVEDPGPGEPPAKQASNAYALLCPPAMRAWLARLFGKVPHPACDQDRRAREQAEFEEMLNSLGAAEYMDATWTGDTLLGETLRSIAAAIDARERNHRESSGTDETGGI